MTYFVRKEWGARPREAGPGQLEAADVRGIALHYPAMNSPLRTVEAVKDALRGWQRFHMDGRGWSDIAYQEAIDQLGNVYELRGLRTQSAANGDTGPNQAYGALLLVVANTEPPSQAMIQATRGRVRRFQEHFPRATAIKGHQEVRPDPTACPGAHVMKLIRAGAFDPTPEEVHNRVTRARGLLGEAAQRLGKASELLADTPPHRELAHQGAERAARLQRAVRDLLGEMPRT